MKTRTTFLLNWHANPYHVPIFVAKHNGYYEEAGIKLAILEPSDPSDVTEIAGLGTVDFALKASIHTIAARTRDLPLKSIGTLLDEPPTGLIAKKSSGIKEFKDIIGKKVGYIGEFGKIIIDDLAKQADINPASYTTVKIGMNVADAIRRGIVDTGIGFINFQKIDLENDGEEVTLLRIDHLADLGCCCFCSIQMITTENMINNNPELCKKIMFATMRGITYTIENPDKALEIFFQEKPYMRNSLNEKIFNHTLPYFSRRLENNERDWNKVFNYTKHLGVLKENSLVTDYYTNDFINQEQFVCKIDSVNKI